MKRVSDCCGADLLLTNGDPICSECREHCGIEEINEDDETPE